MQGFTPFRLVDPSRLLDTNKKVRHPDSIDESIDEEVIPSAEPAKPKRRKLTGQPITVKIMEACPAQLASPFVLHFGRQVYSSGTATAVWTHLQEE